MLAPIALFVYNRPSHTQRTIEALKGNLLAGDSDLVVFSDGAKNTQDAVGVNEVRSYLKSISGFKTTRIVARDHNFGLADSIIDGVTEVVNEYDKVIVLEDDLLTSKYFLTFINQGLDKYQNTDRVVSIHGYVYPVKESLPETFFLKGADCWGWATWKRGWDVFEKDGEKLLVQLKERGLAQEFDFNHSYPFTQMLRDQIAGKNQSWAIRWYASAFLKDKLTLYPGRSLVENIGFDGSGTHCSDSNSYLRNVDDVSIGLESINIEENLEAKKVIEKFFRSNWVSVFKKIGIKIKRLFGSK
jgi:hypothetical protein